MTKLLVLVLAVVALAGCGATSTGAGPTAEQAEQDLKKVNNVGGAPAQARGETQ